MCAAAGERSQSHDESLATICFRIKYAQFPVPATYFDDAEVRFRACDVNLLLDGNTLLI
jgi:hypothetical protein